MAQYTVAEENYLKAVCKHSVDGAAVATNTLAHELGTTPASVTDMIKRLSEKGLADYTPYKGVSLSPLGRQLALQTIRRHRLWEVFLVEKLRFSWDQVHDTAEQLEHIQSPELVERLDSFLGFPRFDPHGDPIPDAEGQMLPRSTQLLADVALGSSVRLAAVLQHGPDFLRYLDRLGLFIGVRLSVVDSIPYDQSVILELESGRVVLNGTVAQSLLVSPA